MTMKWLKYLVIDVIVFIMIHLLLFPSAHASKNKSNNALMIVKNGLMTAIVKDIPLIDILEILTDQTRIEFVLYGEVNRHISANYFRIPFEEGIKRLLRSSNTIIVYTDKHSEFKPAAITRIIIYDKSGSGHTVQGRRQPSRFRTKGTKRKKRRAELIDKVQNTNQIRSLEAYAKQLDDADPVNREIAVNEMADEYEEAALNHLEKALIHDGNDNVRAAAAEEIGGLDSERGIEILTRGLNDPDEDVRRAIVEALGEIGGQDALQALGEALKDDDEVVREIAAEFIEELK